MSIERYAAELNGFLRAAERLCGPTASFWSGAFRTSAGVEAFSEQLVNEWAESQPVRFRGCIEIGYPDVAAKLTTMLSRGLLGRSDRVDGRLEAATIRLLIEDINEYFGLASTTMPVPGTFHPLIDEPVHEIDIESGAHDASFCFASRIGDHFLVVRMIHRSPTKRHGTSSRAADSFA